MEREVRMIQFRSRELAGSRDELRRYLRSMQLKWHPDKNAECADQAVAVFHGVRKLWEKYRL